MSPYHTYTYKQAAGCALHIDVYPGVGAGPRPTILWLHGGGLIFGSRGSLPPEQAHLYTEAGYTVAAADYRLAPESRLPEIAEDILDAWHWLHTEEAARARVDAARLAVVGHSAGGYLALLLGVCGRPSPQAVVSFYGYGEISGPWYSRPDAYYGRQPLVTAEEARSAVGREPVGESGFMPRFRFYLFCRQRGCWPQEVAGRAPEREAEWFAAYEPLRRVSPAYPPTLLLHGEDDTDVPCARSREMAAALAAQGVRHELLILPGRGHVFDQHSEGAPDPVVTATLKQVRRFLDETVVRCSGAAG